MMLKNIRKFAKSTSLKGVPRIVTSDSSFLRTVWTCAVLSFLILGFWQFSVLLIDFLSYPVTQVTSIDTIEYTNPLIYPRITICNLSPIENFNNKTNQNGTTASEMYELFLSGLTTNTKCHGNCSKQDETYSKVIFSELSGIMGLNQFFGVEFEQKIGHQKETFIISCSIGHRKGVGDFYLPCDEEIIFTPLFSPTMSNCFSVNIPWNSAIDGQEMNSLSFILYLDNLSYNESYPFNEHADVGKSGAYMELSAKNEVPLLTDSSVTASPGTHTEVQYEVLSYQDLAPPHGTCSMEEDDDGHICSHKCLVEGLQDLCGCTDFTKGIFLENNDSYPFCGSVSLPWHKLLKFHKCTTKYWHKLEMDICKKKCKFRCKHFGFSVHNAHSVWPCPATVDSFWETMTSKQAIKDRLELNLQYWLENNHGGLKEWDIKFKIIQENFLKVSVKLGSWFQTNVKKTPKYTFASLVSSTAAALNLWSGITMVIFVEIFEMCYRTMILCGMKNPERTKTQTVLHGEQAG